MEIKQKRKYLPRYFAYYLTLLGLMMGGMQINAQVVNLPLEGQAVATSFADNGFGVLVDDPVVRIFDIHNPPYTGKHWPADRASYGWTSAALGQVFGIAINSHTNDIYVTASSSYENYDYRNQPLAYGPAGSGGVYMLNPLSGAITPVTVTVPYNTPNVLNTNQMPNGSPNNPGSGLGNICYDKRHQKLFVTNFEDGKIYRIDATTHLIDDIYDPVVTANYGGTNNPAMKIDDGIEGPAPLGDRLWGLAYNLLENRLYYGVWVKDITARNNRVNVIRSVGLNSHGKVKANDDRLEVVINDYFIARNGRSYISSGVVSDISFSRQNGYTYMAVATRAMSNNYITNAHLSKASLYKKSCSNGNWDLHTHYHVGRHETNSAGGIDFGYTSFDPTQTPQNSGNGERVWVSADNMTWEFNYGRMGATYGMQSTPVEGNTASNYKDVGHFIDYDNEYITVPGRTQEDGYEDKNTIGDVEIFRSSDYEHSMAIDAGEDTVVCPGETVQLGGDPTIEGVPEPVSYEWFSSVTNFYSTKSNPTDTPEETTTYTVLVTDGNGCVYQDQVTVTTFGPEDQTVCEGEKVKLDVGGGRLPDSDYEVEWRNDVGKLISTESVFEVSPGGTTTYTWKVTTTDGTTCSGKITVTVAPNPIVDAGKDTIVCSQEEFVIGGKPTASGGTKPYYYLWTANIGNHPFTRFDANPTVSPSVTTIYTVEVADANRCTASDEMIITMFPAPTANAGGNKDICQDEYVQLGGVPTAIGGSGDFEYAWYVCNDPGNIISTDPNPNVYVTETTTYCLVVTDKKTNCTVADQITIRWFNLVADAGPNKSICHNANGGIYGPTYIGGSPTAKGGTGNQNYTYDWKPDITSEPKPLPISHPPVNPSQTVTYTLTVTDNDGGCIATDQVTVYVNGHTTLLVEAGNDTIICKGESLTIGGNPTASGGTAPYNYVWEHGATPFSNQSNPTVTPTSKRDAFKVTVTDAAGCSNTDVIFVSWHPTATVDAGLDQSSCPGAEVTLGGRPTASGGTPIPNIGYYYIWMDNNGNYLDPVANPLVYPRTTTTYYLWVKDANDCLVSDEVTITIQPTPPVLVSPDQEICENGNVQLSVTSLPGANFQWVSDPTLSCHTCANPVATPTETTTYWVAVRNGFGCRDTGWVTVTVNPLPVADAGPDLEVCAGHLSIIGGGPTGSGGTPFPAPDFYNYAWEDGNGNSVFGNESNPSFSPTYSDTYTVEVTDSKGCKDSDDMQITMVPDIQYIQNAGFDKGITPTARGQVDKAHTNVWFTGAGSPDLFDKDFIGCFPQLLPQTCLSNQANINCVGIPCNHFGYEPHNSSTSIKERYAGLFSAISIFSEDIAWTGALVPTIKNLNFKIEAMEQELAQPLKIGASYCVDLSASLAEYGELTGLTVDDEAYITIKVSEGVQYAEGDIQINTGGDPLVLFYSPLGGRKLHTQKITNTSGWGSPINFEFVADKAYTHIIIESTFPENLQDKVRDILASNPNPNQIEYLMGLQSYVYIDDITLTRSACCVPLRVMPSSSHRKRDVLFGDSNGYETPENINEDGSIDKSRLQEKVQLFPNPTSGKLFVQLPKGNTDDVYIEVLTLDGKTAQPKQLLDVYKGEDSSIDLSALSKGTYFVNITQSNGTVLRERVVLQ